MNALGVVEYHHYLGRFLGDRMPSWNASAPIVGIIDAIFLLAMQRQTEEMRFEVRDDDSLDIRMRTEDTWTELLPVVCTGSALSRLFVIGHLEKGADARSKPQTASATILGRPMVFETEPVRPWREHVRVRIGGPVTPAATLDDAIVLATKAHQGQQDKGGAPYITHPLRLMKKMSTDEEKMTAVLHDVVEDTAITLEDLRAAGYPPAVIEAVDRLTRRKGESYEEFIGRIKPNPLARKVKIADLEDNMDLTRLPSPQKQDFERVEKYRASWQELTNQDQMDPAPQTNFKYYKVLVDGEARGLFVFNRSEKRLDMIAWDHHAKAWEHDPAYVSRYFLSDLDAAEISRAKAEEIARGFGARMPSESEFMKISDLAEEKRKSRQGYT